MTATCTVSSSACVTSGSDSAARRPVKPSANVVRATSPVGQATIRKR